MTKQDLWKPFVVLLVMYLVGTALAKDPNPDNWEDAGYWLFCVYAGAIVLWPVFGWKKQSI